MDETNAGRQAESGVGTRSGNSVCCCTPPQRKRSASGFWPSTLHIRASSPRTVCMEEEKRLNTQTGSLRGGQCTLQTVRFNPDGIGPGRVSPKLFIFDPTGRGRARQLFLLWHAECVEKEERPDTQMVSIRGERYIFDPTGRGRTIDSPLLRFSASPIRRSSTSPFLRFPVSPFLVFPPSPYAFTPPIYS